MAEKARQREGTLMPKSGAVVELQEELKALRIAAKLVVDSWSEGDLAGAVNNLDALLPECDCAERSWYGAQHDSACPWAGEFNPTNKVGATEDDDEEEVQA